LNPERSEVFNIHGDLVILNTQRVFDISEDIVRI